MEVLDNTIYAVENFFDFEYQNLIENHFLDNTKLPWFYALRTVEDLENGAVMDMDTYISPYFYIPFDLNKEDNKEFLNKFKSQFETICSIKIQEFIKGKAALFVNPPIPECHAKRYHPAHADLKEEGYLTCIYYVNTSDGDTKTFYHPESGFDNKLQRLRVSDSYSPKRGSLIFFKSSTLHSGTNPKTHQSRCLLNFTVKI